MTWWLSFGFVWAVTAVGFWALFHGAAMGDSTSTPPTPDAATQCAWCEGWLLASAALLGEVDPMLISHGICDPCAAAMEEEGGLGAETT